MINYYLLSWNFVFSQRVILKFLLKCKIHINYNLVITLIRMYPLKTPICPRRVFIVLMFI